MLISANWDWSWLVQLESTTGTPNSQRANIRKINMRTLFFSELTLRKTFNNLNHKRSRKNNILLYISQDQCIKAYIMPQSMEKGLLKRVDLLKSKLPNAFLN